MTSPGTDSSSRTTLAKRKGAYSYNDAAHHSTLAKRKGAYSYNDAAHHSRFATVPYLVDPNTGIEMFESCEIVEYLEEVYTVK
eukprot:9154215-Pyramimonas_sp.AAC.1